MSGGAERGLCPQDAPRPNPAVDQRFEDIERRLEQVKRQTVLRGDEQDVLPATQPAIQCAGDPQRELMQEEPRARSWLLPKQVDDGVVKDRQARARHTRETHHRNTAASPFPDKAEGRRVHGPIPTIPQLRRISSGRRPGRYLPGAGPTLSVISPK